MEDWKKKNLENIPFKKLAGKFLQSRDNFKQPRMGYTTYTSCQCCSAAVWCNCRCYRSCDPALNCRWYLRSIPLRGIIHQRGTPQLTSIRWKSMVAATLDTSPSNAWIVPMHSAPSSYREMASPTLQTCHITTTPRCFFSRWKRQLNKMTLRCFYVNEIVWILGKAAGRSQLSAGVGKDWYILWWLSQIC